MCVYIHKFFCNRHYAEIPSWISKETCVACMTLFFMRFPCQVEIMVEIPRCVLRASLYHHPRYVRRRGCWQCWQFSLHRTSWEWASAGKPKFWDKGGNKHIWWDWQLVDESKSSLPETNSKFAPEWWRLGDDPASFWGQECFPGRNVSFRECRISSLRNY